MEIKETNSKGLKRSYSVVVESVQIEERIQSKLRELAAQANLPGFRPGKVPPKVLRARFGRSVFGEVVQETIDETAKKTLEENELKPALQPKISVAEDFSEGADLRYTMDVEILPNIVPVDFSSISLERLVAKVDDDDLSEALSRLAAQQRTFEDVKKGVAAKLEDAVVMDFVGTIEGKEFDGGSANDTQLVLGSGQFVPGFEDQLVGSIEGEEREVMVTFPENYPNTELRSKDATFSIKIKQVKNPKIPDVDEDLAKSLGLDALDQLRDRLRDQLQSEFDSVSRARVKRSLLDALESGHDFELPPSLVEAEFEAIWKQVERDRESDRLEPEDKEKSQEDLEREYRAIAGRRVRLGLLLSNVGEANNIALDQAEMNRAIQAQARRFPGQEQEVFKYYQGNPEAATQLHAPIFEDKVVDFILELAKVSEREVSRPVLFEEEAEQDIKKVVRTGSKKPSKKWAVKKTSQKSAGAKKKVAKKSPKKKKSARKKVGPVSRK